MKKIYSMLFAAAAISFGATSCSDFLDEDNKTGETADLAYNTKIGYRRTDSVGLYLHPRLVG